MSDQLYNLSQAVQRHIWHTMDEMLRSRLNEAATARAANYISQPDTDTSSAQIGSTESQYHDLIAPTEYYSAQSTIAETIISQTDSTGLQSQRGATWQHSMTYTANSGFTSGIPRTMGWKGVREGREKELELGEMKGVGRTGKRAAPVPDGLIKAAGRRMAKDEGEALNGFSSNLQDSEMKDGTTKAQAKTREEFEHETLRRRAETIVDSWGDSVLPLHILFHLSVGDCWSSLNPLRISAPNFDPFFNFDEWVNEWVKKGEQLLGEAQTSGGKSEFAGIATVGVPHSLM